MKLKKGIILISLGIFFLQLSLAMPTINFDSSTEGVGGSHTGTSVFVNTTSTADTGHFVVNNFDESLVSWWRMDDVSGSTVVDYMQRNNGTAINQATQNTSGRYGDSFTFDGDTDYIDMGNPASVQITDQLTLAIWAKTTQTATTQLISKIDGATQSSYRLGMASFAVFSVVISGGFESVTSYSNYNDGEWHHIVGTYNGTQLNIYVDGVVAGASKNVAGAIDNDAADLFIGARSDAAQSITGSLDEAMIFNRSLSLAEVKSLYNATANQYSNNFTGLADTTHTYEVYAVDEDGDLAQAIPDSTSPKISLNLPNNNSNLTSSSASFNFTASDNFYSTINCSVIIDGSLNTSNSSTLNNTLTNLIVSGIEDGNHNWSIRCNDAASNTNTSETRLFSVDTTGPSFSSRTYSPSLVDSVDPETNITFSLNISDTHGVSSAHIEFFNGSAWVENVTLGIVGELYTANYTTQESEANYTYRIWANDSLGNSALSSNQTFSSEWDCSWNVTSSLGSTAGWSPEENKEIGTLVLSNTGDSNYSGGCTLNFRLDHNLAAASAATSRIFIDGNWWKPSNTYTISPESSSNIQINATFLDEVSEESLVITTEEISGLTANSSMNTTATIVSNQQGPYLSQEITTSPTTVYLTPGTFNLTAYIRNLMGSSVVNASNTAYNVSFNWSLPSGISNYSGNLTNSFENISDNDLHISSVSLNFTNVSSFSPGLSTIYLYSRGYNLSGDLIEYASGESLLTESVEVTFLCYNESDGVCVVSCGNSQDPDCEATSTEVSEEDSGDSGSGGGGGSSSGGISTESSSSSSELQIVRGEQNEIKIPFKNTNRFKPITDLRISLEGDIAKYITVSPKVIGSLAPEEEINITLKIDSPAYIDLGTQNLKLVISGKRDIVYYHERKEIILEVHELSADTAKELLEESKKIIVSLEEAELSSDELNELLEGSISAMDSYDYELVRDNYNYISEQVSRAIWSKEALEELKNLLQEADRKGIDTQNTQRLIRLAEVSLERGDFDQAEKRSKDAQVTYALEVKGEFGRLLYYAEEYPAEISISLLALLIISFGTIKFGRLRSLKKKIKAYREEEAILKELMNAVQIECFKDRKLSMEEYQIAMEGYQRRMSEVVKKIIELDTKRAYALRFTNAEKRMKIERERIIEMIKETQRKYLKKGSLEARSYDSYIQSYHQRLTEIDEALATLEAKKAFSKGLKNLEGPEVPKKESLR